MVQIGMDDELDDLVKLSFFTDIGKAIVSAKGLSQIIDRVMEQVGMIFAPLNWSLLLVDSRTDELVFRVAVGEAADTLQGKRIPLNKGLSGWIARTGQAVIIRDVKKDKRFSDEIDKMTGFTTESLIGVPLRTGEKVIGVIELVNKLSGEPFSGLELKVLSTIADFAAIALEKEFYIKAIRKVSQLDHLTGVLNRRSFDRIFDREMERCKRYGTCLSVLMLDIDNFKQINDEKGHLHGDGVLQRCATILKEEVRKVDYVARFGGDEFVVLMPETTEELAAKVRSRILKRIERKGIEEPEYAFSASIGMHTAGPDGVIDLLNKGDEAMYREKDRSRPLTPNQDLLEFLEEEETAYPYD